MGLPAQFTDERTIPPRMNILLTAVFRKVPEGFIGFVEELPGANTQGATLELRRGQISKKLRLLCLKRIARYSRRI